MKPILGSEESTDTGGWAQIAIDIFKQLAPCDTHRMLGWMVKQVTQDDEIIPLILSYHEGKEEVCINQELVNLGLATSTKFQKKTVQGKYFCWMTIKLRRWKKFDNYIRNYCMTLFILISK